MIQPIIESSKKFMDNDIYFMEIVSDKIVINNNYAGVAVLDSDLNTVKEMDIMADLVIDLSFVHENEIVLCCYENHCLIYIDLNFYDYKVILLQEALSEVNFLPLYEWRDNTLLLLVDDGAALVCVDVLNGSVQVADNVADGRYSFMRSDWDKIKKYTLYKAYPAKREAIVERDNAVQLINYESGIGTTLKAELFEIPPYYFYDVEAVGDCVLQLSEKRIIVLRGEERFVFSPNALGDRFFGAKLIEKENKIYLLSLLGSCSDNTSGVIEKYCMGTEEK